MVSVPPIVAVLPEPEYANVKLLAAVPEVGLSISEAPDGTLSAVPVLLRVTVTPPVAGCMVTAVPVILILLSDIVGTPVTVMADGVLNTTLEPVHGTTFGDQLVAVVHRPVAPPIHVAVGPVDGTVYEYKAPLLSS